MRDNITLFCGDPLIFKPLSLLWRIVVAMGIICILKYMKIASLAGDFRYVEPEAHEALPQEDEI
jgi:hypothetical protein